MAPSEQKEAGASEGQVQLRGRANEKVNKELVQMGLAGWILRAPSSIEDCIGRRLSLAFPGSEGDLPHRRYWEGYKDPESHIWL